MSVVLAVLIAVALSLGCELINHACLEKKGSASGTHLISSLGIYIIVVQAIAIIWGNKTKVLRQGVDGVFHLEQNG